MPIKGLQPRRPAAVIFDMDGLMLDSERLDLWAWQTVAARRGFGFSESLHRTLIGRRTVETQADLRAHYGPDFDFATVYAEVRALWRETLRTHGVPLKAGLLELLEFLDSARIPRAVATSTARENALLSLGTLVDRMDAVVCGDEVARSKPAPDIYLRAAESLGVPASECLALEDSIPGVTAAHAAGMTVVMVPDLVPPTAGVPYVCDSLHQVTAWLRATGPAAGARQS
jgi:HAD superfamily hydrolase (TIGR01509 family)